MAEAKISTWTSAQKNALRQAILEANPANNVILSSPSKGDGIGKGFYWTHGAFDNVPEGAPNNQVSRWGYNTGFGGGRVDPSDVSVALSMEGCWTKPNGTEVWEFHLSYYDRENTEWRPWSWMVDKDSTTWEFATMASAIAFQPPKQQQYFAMFEPHKVVFRLHSVSGVPTNGIQFQGVSETVTSIGGFGGTTAIDFTTRIWANGGLGFDATSPFLDGDATYVFARNPGGTAYAPFLGASFEARASANPSLTLFHSGGSRYGGVRLSGGSGNLMQIGGSGGGSGIISSIAIGTDVMGASASAVLEVAASNIKGTGADLELATASKGVILKSPDGTRYKVTVANGGTLNVTAA